MEVSTIRTSYVDEVRSDQMYSSVVKLIYSRTAKPKLKKRKLSMDLNPVQVQEGRRLKKTKRWASQEYELLSPEAA